MEEDLNTPKIIRAVLIDDRRIELYWNTQIQGAYDERSFAVRYHGEIRKLTHWTKDKEWDYGTVYQKESMRTTLCLEEPVNPALAGKLTVQVTGNMADLMDCPVNREIIYQVTYEAYYTQFLTCGSGVTVKAGKTVSQKTMKLAAVIIDIMLEKIPGYGPTLMQSAIMKNTLQHLVRCGSMLCRRGWMAGGMAFAVRSIHVKNCIFMIRRAMSS